MKKTKIIIPAMGMLLLGTAASVTGTVAWFSMNASVNVTGMTVKTTVSDNLFIAGDTLASVAKKTDSEFGPGPLNQSVPGILEPVSTVNGTSFWYTKVANADGSILDGQNWVAYSAANATDTTNYDSAFSEYYGVTKTAAAALITAETGAKPYVDYVFQLKAVNSAGTATPLKLTALTLTYGSAVDGSKAFRTAVFVEDITSANPAGGVGTLKSIFAPSGADNQESGKAVSSATATAAVTYNTAGNLDSVPANSTKQYKVVVRLWIEGEDKACTNSTFAALTSSWALTLTCTLDTTTSAVSALATA